jgi:hypothetical protein
MWGEDWSGIFVGNTEGTSGRVFYSKNNFESGGMQISAVIGIGCGDFDRRRRWDELIDEMC